MRSRDAAHPSFASHKSSSDEATSASGQICFAYESTERICEQRTKSAYYRLFPRFTAMEDPQHHETGAVKAVAKDVFGVRNFEH